jgi:dynein heavy chain
MVLKGDYEAAVRMMGDTSFLSALVNFPRDAMTDETVELLQPYFAAPDFNFESAKKVRKKAGGCGCGRRAAGALSTHCPIPLSPPLL